MTSNTRTISGLLLLVAGALILMGIVTAETQYPADRHYSTANNEVSDLAATRPPDSVITHPSAEIFNGTMMITGAMTFAAALLLRRDNRRRVVPYMMALFGMSVFLVGIFPGNNAVVHPLVAMATFIFGGLTCIAGARVVRGPLRYVSVGLGGVTLFFLILSGLFIPVLGDGGTERWVAYPVVLWMVAFGGYLLGATRAASPLRDSAHRAERPVASVV